MIKSNKLSIKIGEKSILKAVSTRIEKGRVTAILGPNGSGKSTLLKCLTGSLKPTSGTVTFDGKPLDSYSLNELSLRRAVLSQSTSVHFPFTALDIAMMGRNPYASSCSAETNHVVVLQALECLDALHLKERIFPTLSGGEQQRVQLARALAQLWDKEDAFLFLDEPTSALDLKHQHQLLRCVSELAEKKHFGVCFVVHDLTLALRYATHVIVLKNGKRFAEGSSEAVLNKDTIENVFEVPEEFAFGFKKSK